MTVINEVRCLNDIPQFEEMLLPFRHLHLKRKPKIAIVGLPGAGKSLSLGVVNLNQFMILGEPCWSNLPVKYTYRIPDDVAAKYGLKGGKATFESKPLDKIKLIRLTGEYHDGLTSIDEINIEYADAYKSQTNVNFYLDQAEQQYRKDNLGLTCTTIDEMWIDPRIRSIIDIYIICKDLALTPDGLTSKAEEGVNIRWTVYPMTDYFNGVPWSHSKTVYTAVLHAKPFWGIVDTNYKQATGKKYAQDIFKDTVPYPAGGVNKMAVEEYSRWGQLYKAITGLRDMGIKRLSSDEMWKYLEQFYPDVDKRYLGQQLSAMGIERQYGRRGGDFLIESFKLEQPANEKRLVIA